MTNEELEKKQDGAEFDNERTDIAGADNKSAQTSNNTFDGQMPPPNNPGGNYYGQMPPNNPGGNYYGQMPPNNPGGNYYGQMPPNNPSGNYYGQTGRYNAVPAPNNGTAPVTDRLSMLINKFVQSLNTKEGRYRAITVGLSFLLFFVTIFSLGGAIIRGGETRLTPWQVIWARSAVSLDDRESSGIKLLFYIYKFFYIAGVVASIVLLIWKIYMLLSGNKKLYTRLNYIMGFWLLFLLLSMLMAFNCINILSVAGDDNLTTSITGFFIFGLIIIIAKIIIGVRINKENENDELKEAGLSLAQSFIFFTFMLGTLITPIYIFPGSPQRMNGLDVLLSRNDVLNFLRMSSAIKAIYAMLFFGSLISFAINIVLFFRKPKSFIRFNSFNSFFNLSALIVFAVIGANYTIVYFFFFMEGQVGIEEIFSVSMNTYAYIPLVLLIVFSLGVAASKLAFSKVNVVYKVFAGSGGGTARNQSEGDKKKTPVSEEVSVYDPIPAFSEIDVRLAQLEEEYQEKKLRAADGITLPELVAHVVEYAACSKEHLSYGKVDIKCFIAGLAASKLSILQGMSGTGKTSLPKIFMEAIDGYCDLVAVESSWRDKHELTGYYNEFNKKFTPKSFTQYLYKAVLTPDVPYFIVLDELNLSRIEYYFSDFLSLIEMREEERYIKLFDVQLYPYSEEREEYLALRDGHTIDIPKNVWFIGTANRDESTFEISDKVYDRAQTIIFNKRAPKIQSRVMGYYKKFVPLSVLKKLFDDARSISFDAESNAVIKQVESLLVPYKISFGNRVLKQMEDFVKVYVACSDVTSSADFGKFIHEGIDCILLSKVIRKLELKQINDIDSLIEEFEALDLPKCTDFLLSLTENE